MVMRNPEVSGDDRSLDQSLTGSERLGVMRESLAVLPPERALIRGGFVDFPGEETMTEETEIPEESDIFFGMTAEEIALYIEMMLFGDPILEEPLVEDPALEDPLLEDPAIVDDAVVDDTAIESPGIEEATITDEEYEELLFELLLTP